MRVIQQTNRELGIGVDIGGTKTLVVIADRAGRPVMKEKLKTASRIEDLLQDVQTVIAKSGVTPEIAVGMGIGVPGWVNTESGCAIDVPSLKWRNVNVRDIFQRHFGLPVVINNDVNLSLLGEKWLGNGQNHDNIFYLAIGTGIGSAILANGRLIEGADYAAGEIGYFIDESDVRNGHRSVNLEFGAFEKKASGSALTEKGRQIGLTPAALFLEYQKGNPVAAAVIEDFVLRLAIVIANVVCLINPEIVILGGGVSESLTVVLERINDKVAAYVPIPAHIILSKLGGEAGAFGAVAYLFQKKNEGGFP